MKKSSDSFQTVPFDNGRRLTTDIGWLARQKHTIHGLVEVDVTKPRQHIREHKAKTGETLSFTAFLVACVGRAVDLDKSVHACRNWRDQLVLFDEVDIVTPVEITVAGKKTLTGHITRAANRKTFREIHAEIRETQARTHSLEGEEENFVKVYVALPTLVRRLLLWMITQSPNAIKQMRGTVGLTAVGMFGKGGWGIGALVHTLGVTVGGITEKPVVIDGRIEIRECLSLELAFDHDVVDGAPAARFAQRLTELIERGYSLCDQPE